LRISIASCITGISDMLPIMMATFIFLYLNFEKI
jgi:hypothetical protein